MAAISAHGPRTGTIEVVRERPGNRRGIRRVRHQADRRRGTGRLPRRAHAPGRSAGRHQLLAAVRAGRLPGAAGGGGDGDDRREGHRAPGPEGHRRRGEGRRDGAGHPRTGQLRGDHAGRPVGGRDQGAVPLGSRGAVAGPRPGRGAAVQAGGDPAERTPADAQAPGLPGRLGGGAPPAGRGRRAGAVPPGRDQGDGLDGRRGRGDQALAGRPASHRADHQPARGRGGAARVTARVRPAASREP